MKQKTLSEHANELEEFMRKRGQNENQISQYHYIFKVFIDYSTSHGELYFNEELLRKCLKEHYRIETFEAILSRNEHYKKKIVRSYRLLLDKSEGKSIVSRYVDKEPVLKTQIFANAINSFANLHRTAGYSKKTIELYSKDAEKFLVFSEQQEIYEFVQIHAELIHKYILSLSRYSKVTIKHSLCNLRLFLRFLHIEGIISEMLDAVIVMPRVRDQLRIPSVWRREEILKILSAIDRENPTGKRDYAMILMIARLGIRIGDICNLKFENLDWRNGQIYFVQSKTQTPISLPLLKDIGWALIDYIQNGRPKVDLPNIFITHISPFKNFSDGNHHFKMIEKYMQLAHIPIKQKRKLGMHSLRYTLATVMLENHENFHNISAILGHRSEDSTSVYLKASYELLRDCSIVPLEVIK